MPPALIWAGGSGDRALAEGQFAALGYAACEWRASASLPEALAAAAGLRAPGWTLVAAGDVMLLRRYDADAVAASAPPGAGLLLLDLAAPSGGPAPSGVGPSPVDWRAAGPDPGACRLFAVRRGGGGSPAFAFRLSLAGGPSTESVEEEALDRLSRREPPRDPPSQHLHFWAGFGESDPRFLDRLLLLAASPGASRRPATFVSVFPNRPPHPPVDAARLRVAFSGEVYSQDPALFDLSLSMEATDPARRVVCCPLFSYFAYHCGSTGFNAWPMLMRPRPPSPKPLFCAATVSNPAGAERNRFFAKLNAAKRVDGLGGALNNCGGRRLPRGAEGRAQLAAYRFVLCFENTLSPRYLTEKLLEAWVAGAVPIYGGAAMAREWLDPAAFLWLEDGSEAAMDRLVARVLALDADPGAYEAVRARPLLREPRVPRELSVEGIAAAAGLALALPLPRPSAADSRGGGE